MQKITPNYEFQIYSNVLRVFDILSEPRGIPLKMSDVLLNFEKEALGCKLKVTESPLSYINQKRRLESEIYLSIYIPYPILMKWHELVRMKDERGNEFNYIDLLNFSIPGRWFKLSKTRKRLVMDSLRPPSRLLHVVFAI